MSETKVCERCEELDCEADRYRKTMLRPRETIGPSHEAFWPLVTCSFKASNLKATYKARAEAAEGKVERVRELANGYAAHQYTGGGDYGTGAEEAFHSVADDILEALNG